LHKELLVVPLGRIGFLAVRPAFLVVARRFLRQVGGEGFEYTPRALDWNLDT
jgi:hypothetical protein